jgi:hypothetical protein
MERLIIALLFVIYLSYRVSAKEQNGKAISIFNVVKFKNDVCAGGGNQNGTCFTAEECSAIDGTASGSCAEGYGVCCIVSLECGKSSKQNCTYLVQSAVTAPTTNPCTYTICPTSSNICRIRLDFATFTIEGPSTSTSTDAFNAVSMVNDNYGRCVTDTFTVSSSAGAVPVICGTNTGQHIYVDSDGEQCSSASFTFGGTTATRQYNIKILQYDCRNEMGGPAGCLQFFTNDMGTFSSFNYVTPATPEAADTAHLANQNYNICIRKNNGKCRICYVPSIIGAVANMNPSAFGLSIGTMAMKADLGTNCVTDFLEILGLASDADSLIDITAATAAVRTLNQGKICGMAFDALGVAAAGANAPVPVCTSTLPFNVRFVSDGSEHMNEILAAMGPPTGRIGFSITYLQRDC